MKRFPDVARSQAGADLFAVQRGDEPLDWKPTKAVGPGVNEIRIRDKAGAFRVIYLATLAEGSSTGYRINV